MLFRTKETVALACLSFVGGLSLLSGLSRCSGRDVLQAQELWPGISQAQGSFSFSLFSDPLVFFLNTIYTYFRKHQLAISPHPHVLSNLEKGWHWFLYRRREGTWGLAQAWYGWGTSAPSCFHLERKREGRDRRDTSVHTPMGFPFCPRYRHERMLNACALHTCKVCALVSQLSPCPESLLTLVFYHLYKGIIA